MHFAPSRFRCPVAALAMALLAGCASTDTAVFVTKTSIGIDVDAAPPNASIAYDRTEGFFGPSYANGEAPPVAAMIQTGGSVFNPQIRQLYATGNAARLATDLNSEKPAPRGEITGKPRLMFFGTSTTIGLKVTFKPDAPVPSSFTFGFKRKEASYIPLQPVTGANGQIVYKYPAVFASVDSTTKAEQLENTSLRLSQFFATGGAAELLAWSQRETFTQRAADLIAAGRKTTGDQRATALSILRTYVAFDPARHAAEIQKAWEDAARLGLFSSPSVLDLLKNPPPGRTAAGIYAAEIATPDLDDPARTTLLQLHLKTLRALLPRT